MRVIEVLIDITLVDCCYRFGKICLRDLPAIRAIRSPVELGPEAKRWLKWMIHVEGGIFPTLGACSVCLFNETSQGLNSMTIKSSNLLNHSDTDYQPTVRTRSQPKLQTAFAAVGIQLLRLHLPSILLAPHGTDPGISTCPLPVRRPACLISALHA
jgi:hypothetical protein